MVRIVIADDHAIVREGLKRVVSSVDGIEVAGEAANGGEVLDRVRQLAFDVLVLDLSMPGRSGMELIRQVHAERPRVRVLVLSMHHETQYAVRALKSGASGYLTKESAPAQLEQAIRKVAGGGAWITAEVAQQLALGAMAGGEVAPHELLTDREFEVLRRLAAGESVTDMARALHLSVKTVSTHKSHGMAKMGLANQSELVLYALRHGLIEGVDP